MTFLFDIGRVLLDFDYESSLSRLFPPGTGCIGDRLHALLEKRHEFETGSITTEEFTTWALEMLGCPAGPEEFLDAWRNIFTPVGSMWHTVRRLSAAGHRLVLFSNTSAIHCPWVFGEFPEFSLFPEAVLSYQVGAVKPYPPIYQFAIGSLGLVPEETLYIDDLPENIATGRSFGFHCHTYDLKNHAAFEQWLASFGI